MRGGWRPGAWLGGLVLGVLGCGGDPPPVESPPPEVPTERAQSEAPAGSSSAEAAPPVRVGPVPAAVLGTAHPLFVQAAAPDGRWVAACQARADTDGDGEIQVHLGHHGEIFGDAVALYLMSEAEPDGREIDAFVAADPRGRWVAYVDGAALMLRDFVTGTDVDLSAAGATTRREPNPTLPHRGAAFDTPGEHVLFIRERGGGERVVVRDLDGGSEREIDTGTGRVWRAMFLGDGQWLAVAVVNADTNGNGQLDLPVQQTTLAGGACRGAAMSYSTYGFQGDAWQWQFFRMSDGLHETRDVVAWFDDVLVVKDPSRGLLLRTAGGAETPIVPAACEAHVYAVHAATRALLVACGPDGSTQELRLYDPNGVREVGVDVEIDEQFTEWRQARILAMSGEALVDLATGRRHPRAYAGEQGIDEERGVLLETVRGGITRFRELASGRTTNVTGGTEAYIYGQQFGRFTAVTRGDEVLMFDLHGRRLLGALPAMPLAVRDDSLSLVPAAGQSPIPKGPLRWVAPEP